MGGSVGEGGVSDPPDKDGPVTAWEPEGLAEGVRLDVPAGPVAAAGATFVDCRVSGGVLAEADLARAAWRGGGWSGVRVVGGRLARSSWRGVVIEDCALSGCELYGAVLHDVVVRRGTLDSVNLRGARLRDVVFEDCVLRDVDLGAASLVRVSFPGCRIERLDIQKAVFEQVDLRGAEVEVARGIDRLAGAIVDTGQLMALAPALAAHLGLDVR
jgi:uncharacterized protein YjbI with pentapeptide repeats